MILYIIVVVLLGIIGVLLFLIFSKKTCPKNKLSLSSLQSVSCGSYNPIPFHYDMTVNNNNWTIQTVPDYEFTQGCVNYVPENVQFQPDGMHILFNNKTNGVWNSGRVYGNHFFGYGLFSVCATIPQGPLLWPAIWMLGNRSNNWPQQGEIDIMETIGTQSNNLNDIYGTVHFNTSGGFAQAPPGAPMPLPSPPPAIGTTNYNGSIDITQGKYSFAVEWQQDHITWFYWADPNGYNNPLDSNGNIRTDLNVGGTLNLVNLINGCGGNADCMDAFDATKNNYKFLFNMTVGGAWSGANTPSCTSQGGCTSCPGVPNSVTDFIIHDVKVFTKS